MPGDAENPKKAFTPPPLIWNALYERLFLAWKTKTLDF